MNNKLKLASLLLILPLFTVALITNIPDVDATKAHGSSGYLATKSYGTKNADKVCGAELCSKKIDKS